MAIINRKPKTIAAADVEALAHKKDDEALAAGQSASHYRALAVDAEQQAHDATLKREAAFKAASILQDAGL